MSGTPSADGREASLAAGNAALIAALQEISGRLPSFGADSEEVWANRRWCGEFRELQRIARVALAEHCHRQERAR